MQDIPDPNDYHRGNLPTGKVEKEVSVFVGNEHNGFQAMRKLIKDVNGQRWYCAPQPTKPVEYACWRIAAPAHSHLNWLIERVVELENS